MVLASEVTHHFARIPKDRSWGTLASHFFNQYKRYSPFELVVITHWREGERERRRERYGERED